MGELASPVFGSEVPQVSGFHDIEEVPPMSYPFPVGDIVRVVSDAAPCGVGGVPLPCAPAFHAVGIPAGFHMDCVADCPVAAAGRSRGLNVVVVFVELTGPGPWAR